MRTDDVLDQIDTALGDWDVSGDAMRCAPAPEVRVPKLSIRRGDGEWQELPGVTRVEMTFSDDPGGSVAFCTVTVDTSAVMEQLGRLRSAFDAYAEAVQPRIAEAARAIKQGFQVMQQAGLCDDHGKPVRSRDRPAWQSPYGPARRRR